MKQWFGLVGWESIRHCEANFSLAEAIFIERFAAKIASSAEKPSRKDDHFLSGMECACQKIDHAGLKAKRRNSGLALLGGKA